MNLIYYAHSYRAPDAGVVEFFSELMRSENLIASLDPPSDRLNSAKPERHLRSTDGMVAVITAREGGASPYILYEMFLCLRAKKPLLVFVEDVLPPNLVPARILQRRFSRRGLLRQVRDHRHAIRMLRSYIGDEPPPNYQPNTGPRRCLLTGTQDLPDSVAQDFEAHLMTLGYTPKPLRGEITACLYEKMLQEEIAGAELAIACVDSTADRAEFFLGTLHATLTPTIVLTNNLSFKFHEKVPREYQARIVDYSDTNALRQIIAEEIAIFEEEYVDLENQEKVMRYAELLLNETVQPGHYASDLRRIFVKELYMGDKYINYGQAGSMGRESTGTIVNYGQVWQQIKDKTDLNALASELATLRASLRQKAQTPEEDKAVAAVADAELEAKKGDGASVLAKLANAGTWVLGVAKEIGVKLATEALKKSLGM